MSTSKVTQVRTSSSPESSRFEAERRAKFVRGLGGSVSGYCDGYRDGFEHGVAWLLGDARDPLALEYRPASGMNLSKDFYKHNSKERARILEWFRQLP
jgi:hypothetical protein